MNKTVIILYSIIILFTAACTFDYGETESSERETPDLIMEHVIYIRVRSSDPIARFQAERAERYEKQGIMKIQNFTFEQYGERGNEVNTFGEAGHALIDIETGDIFMSNGVRLEIESEDIILVTSQLDWKDEPRILSTGERDEVNIFQENGTGFTGIGLRVEARNRIWEFTGNVSGIYISDEDTENEEQETDDIEQIQTGRVSDAEPADTTTEYKEYDKEDEDADLDNRDDFDDEAK